jgi:hypothetical protein
MNVHMNVVGAMARWPKPVEVDRGIRVTTHCLYPSNSAVSIIVSRSAEGFIVDDDAAVLDEVAQVSISAQRISSLIKAVAKPFGLKVSERNAIVSPTVTDSELEAAMVLVANASSVAAAHALNNLRPPRRSMRKAIERLLSEKFPNRWAGGAKLPGHSNKMHKFDYIISLPGEKQLVLDLVSPESNSVNAAVVAHLDLAGAANSKIEQRIVYDDSLTWTAADLALLRVGARPVPLSRLGAALERLAP